LKIKGFNPDWTDKPPRQGTYRSIFKWGAPDGFKHPNQRLYDLIKKEFQMTDADFKIKQNQGNEQVKLARRARLTDQQVERFIQIAGRENVSLDDYSRAKYASGKTMEEAMQLRRGIAGETADLIVVDKTLLFRGRTIEKFPLCVKEKVTTTYVASGWIAVQRFFRNMR